MLFDFDELYSASTIYSARRWAITSDVYDAQIYGRLSANITSNRLFNWPKLLGLYADGFSSIFVPECVPYNIPHMFQ